MVVVILKIEHYNDCHCQYNKMMIIVDQIDGRVITFEKEIDSCIILFDNINLPQHSTNILEYHIFIELRG